MGNKRGSHLFDLIQTLSKGEKRLVSTRIKGQNHGRSPAYYDVFTAVESARSFDQASTRIDRLGLSNRNLASTKEFVYRFVLDTLKDHPTHEGVVSTIEGQLHHVRILFKKGLHKQAEKVLLSTKKLCVQYEELEKLLEVLRWERRLSQLIWRIDQVDERVRQIILEEGETLRKLTDLNKVSQVYYYLIATFNSEIGSSEKVKEDLGSRMSLPHMEPTNKDLSYRATLLHHSAWFMYHTIRGEHLKANGWIQRTVDHLETQPLLVADDPANYLSTVYNLLSSQFNLDLYGDLFPAIDKFKDWMVRLSVKPTPLLKAQTFMRSTTAELEAYNYQGNYLVAAEVVAVVESEIDRHADWIGRIDLVFLNYMCSHTLLATGDFKGALGWLNRILHARMPTDRPDILATIPVFEMMIHFELGNYDLLESLYRSAKRRLLRHNAWDSAIELFCNGICFQLPDKASAKEQQEVIGELVEQIRKARQGRHVLNSRHLDLVRWLEAKQKGGLMSAG